MSLSLAFNTAQSSLAANSAKIALSSRNVAGAGEASASRKIAVTTTAADGSVRVVSITRATGSALFERMLGATSDSAAQQALADGLGRLAQTVGDPQDPTSPVARLGTLKDALARAADTPDDMTLAQAAVTAAQDLASSLNTATDTVQQVRTDADAAIATSVGTVNDLLHQFEAENSAIVKGSAAGADMTDALDRRDSILARLSEEIGISTVTRANNDIVIYTEGGATLFETTARTVGFTPAHTLDANTQGGSVFVDGVSVTGRDATMPVRTGRIAGLTQLRDDAASTYQTQLDELARGLTDAFKETDGVGNTRAGLFVPAAGSATVPGALAPGLAGTLAVNAAVDVAQGGDIRLLRDGGMNGAPFAANTSGAASFAGRLKALSAALDAPRAYDGAAQLSDNQSLISFGTASVSWLEGARKAADTRLDSQKTVLSQASNALSAATGVNLDDEYASQLELERGYQATSKLMGVVNQLYDSLFQMIG